MGLDREDIERLHADAKRVRKNFRYISQDLKRAPENIDLLRQRDRLKARYEQIQAQLNEARESEKSLSDDPDEPEVPPVDMSIFEPKPFDIPPAVYVEQRGRGAAGGGGQRLTFKDIRMALGIALLVVILPFYYLMFMKDLRFYEVPTRSMEPTLLAGDRIIAVKPSTYVRGDVVVLPDPASPGEYLVKRIVAMGGDTVEVASESVFVNGQPILEPYIKEPPQYSAGPFKVPDGDVYLLGDNRNESEDSHLWGGGRPLDELRGKVRWIYSPSGRRGSMADYSAAFSDVLAPQ